MNKIVIKSSVIIASLYFHCMIFAHQPTSPNAELTFDKPYVFISLGEGCKVAGYIRGSLLTSYAYPFDWTLSTDFESIYQVILHDFHNYMQSNHLEDLHFFDRKMDLFPDEPKNLADRWVLETTYNIESRHDFTVHKNIDEVYPEVIDKINRRVQRFYQTLQRTDITIFLVRIMITKEQTLRFRNLMKSKFPRAQFVLVALNNTPDFRSHWHEHHIENFYFDDPVYQWDISINNYRYNNGSYGDDWNYIVNELLEKYVHKN